MMDSAGPNQNPPDFMAPRRGFLVCEVVPCFVPIAIAIPNARASATASAKTMGIAGDFPGQLYEATDWNCGYPDMVRLPNDEIFCVFYTAYRHGDSEIHGLWLQDET